MRFFSLFSGIGGFDLGLERAGHECVGACEIDDKAGAVYAEHWPEVPVWRDARSIDPGRLPDYDLLCAGFPCQSFSHAGTRLGFADARGTLFFEILRLARRRGRRRLLLENVESLLWHDRGRTFARILLALEESGFDVGWQVLNGRHWLPQNRPRLFLDCVPASRGPHTAKVLPHAGGPGMVSEGTLKVVVGPDTPAPEAGILNCLCATYYKHRFNATAIREADGRLRYLLPDECDMLQGFPAGWTERGAGGERVADTHRYRLAGNSVMPPVAEFLGRLVREAERG